MLKAGFIGAGPRATSAHYPCIERLHDKVRLEAVCELDENRLAHVVEKYDIPQSFSDHRDMLELDLDVVYCVMHERWLLQPALACLNAGRHILIEKPPGANSEETRQLLDAAVSNNVYAMVGFQRRFAAVTREAIRRVTAKGPVSVATTTFNKQILGGDGSEFSTTLWNDVCHVVDLLRYMAGGQATEITAHRDRFGGDSRNCYTAMVRFHNGATGVVFGNRASGGRVLRSELHGVGVGCYMKIPHEIEILADNRSEILHGWEIDQAEEEDQRRYEGTLHLHEHFLDCVNRGEVPLTDLRDVVHSIDLVDRIEGELSAEG